MSEPHAAPVPSTWFLPAGRAEPEVLAEQIRLAAAHPVVDALLRTWSGALAVVNAQRQIVAQNAGWLDAMGVADPAAVLGLRPGEAIGCDQSAAHPGGCGTARACAGCGAALALVASMAREQPEERDCVLRVRRGGVERHLDLHVRAAPLDVEGSRFTLVTVHDASGPRRLAALERGFTQDVAAQVWELCRATAALQAGEAGATPAGVHASAARLGREVQLLQALSGSQPGDLHAGLEPVEAAAALARLGRRFAWHGAAAGRRLALEPAPAGTTLRTDAFLLDRVLSALAQNALEATAPGGTARVAAVALPDGVAFRVHNAGALPAGVEARLFQRYFTTREGEGRGQGTWLARLLAERWLGGRLGYTTSAAAGTTFELWLPREPPAPSPRTTGADA